MPRWIMLVLLALGALPARAADDVAAFYKGRTVTMVIGTSPGGGYDLYARLLAKHLAGHIPGNPAIVPQNMTGAGSLRAMMYLYSVAAKDGSVFGTFSRSMPLAPVMGLPGASFDSRKLTWLGSVAKDTPTCIAWSTSPVKNWADLFTQEFKAGGEGKSADPDVEAGILKNVFGAKVKLVTGYPGSSNIILAVERGELDGSCGISWSTIRGAHPAWLTEHQVNILVQVALEPDAAMPDVPFLYGLAKTEEQRQVLKLLLAPQAIARPFAAPPGLPPERAAALRAAFDATMQDPAFLAEAERLNLPISPLSAAQVETLIGAIYETPKDVVHEAATVGGY